MSLKLAYTLAIWTPALTILLLAGLSFYVWRRRSVPGARPLLAWTFLAALVLASTTLKTAATDPKVAIACFLLRDALLLSTVTAEMCFVLEYVWPGRWLTRRNLGLLALPCLVVILLETTGEGRWIWRQLEIGPEGTFVTRLAPVGVLFTIYGMGLFLANLAALLWLFLHSPQHRWPAAIMLITQASVRGMLLLQMVGRPVLPPEVLDGVLFLLTCLAYTLALFGFRIFDPLPAARQTVIEQIQDGMVVLDLQDRIASLNPAAERMLGVTEKQARRRPVRELLSAYPEAAGSDRDEIELSLGAGQERPGTSAARHYILTSSRLDDWRGQAVGRLLLLRDVTEQKRAQAQLLAQQRNLTMLNEREQMARNLHDSFGQTLGYASIQVEAASKLIQDDQIARALTQLNALAGALREAHAEVRAYILDLYSTLAPQQPFFTALRRYLKGYTHNFGIQALLTSDERLGEDPFSPEVRMQVYYLLQEALANARKHGHARCVQVSVAGGDDTITLAVQDDGDGFNSTQAAGEGHFGLQFMYERAGQLGGRLQIDSAPGKGTRLVLEIPVMNDARTG